eukprot:1841434-Amphidinium_carterae.2
MLNSVFLAIGSLLFGGPSSFSLNEVRSQTRPMNPYDSIAAVVELPKVDGPYAFIVKLEIGACYVGLAAWCFSIARLSYMGAALST